MSDCVFSAERAGGAGGEARAEETALQEGESFFSCSYNNQLFWVTAHMRWSYATSPGVCVSVCVCVCV